jgi:hypothetical protein
MFTFCSKEIPRTAIYIKNNHRVGGPSDGQMRVLSERVLNWLVLLNRYAELNILQH